MSWIERPREEWIPVGVPAIIPKELFESTQKRLQENLRYSQRNSKREYLLSGLVRHSCGHRMRGKTSHNRAYYNCYIADKTRAPVDEWGEPQKCRKGWVSGTALEKLVWDTVTELLKNPQLLIDELENLSELDSTTREVAEEELAKIRKRQKAVRDEERRLVEGYRKGLYPDFMMREEMERLEAEKIELADRCRALETQIKVDPILWTT